MSHTQVLPKDLAEKLAEFAESIAYTNGVSGERYSKAQVAENLNDKEAQEEKKPYLQDELVFVVPQALEEDEDAREGLVHTPLWLAQIREARV